MKPLIQHQANNTQTHHVIDSQQPRPACFWESYYHVRKGRAMAAAKAGLLRAVFRRGRGGLTQAWILPADAHAWFLAGLPSSEEVTPVLRVDRAIRHDRPFVIKCLGDRNPSENAKG